jgi:hypothetical protein
MRKGLLLTLIVGALVLSTNVARAAAPVINEIPIIIISDLEDNTASVDNNRFVFDNAFNFSDMVTDADTPEANLMWSFDYDPAGSGQVGNININGIARLDVAGSGNPDAPGSLDIRAAGAAASFREVNLSPLPEASPYADPGAGSTVAVPGFGNLNNVVGDLAVTYYVSDGTANDSDGSFVFTTNSAFITGTPDTVVSGLPTLSFSPVSLTGWTFTPGDGSFVAAASSGTTGGLQITLPSAVPTTSLALYTGIWSNNALASYLYAANTLYAVRAGLAATAGQDAAAQTRLRVGALGGTIDNGFVINESNPADPFNFTGTATNYLAYFRPADLDTNGQNQAAFDSLDNGNAAGRTVTLSTLESASTDPATYLGSASTVPGSSFTGGGFGSWTYVNFGVLTFGSVTVTDNTGTSGTASGRIQHTDSGTGSLGAAAEWVNPATADLMETAAGATYRSVWTFADDDGAGNDGSYVRVRLRNGYTDPSLSIEYEMRGVGPLFDTVGDNVQGTYDTFWVGPSISGTPGAGNIGDDLIHAFGLFNFAAQPQHDGTADLFSVRTEELGPDDPNVP